MNFENRDLFGNKLQTCLPDFSNVLDTEALPSVWGNGMIYECYAAMTDQPWCSSIVRSNTKGPELSEVSKRRQISTSVHQEPPKPWNTIDLQTVPSKEQKEMKVERKSSTISKSMTSRQKLQHNQSERRYRRNLDAEFLQLEDVVHQPPEEKPKASTRVSKRSRRVRLLSMARQRILELRKEVMSLKMKLQALREATMPDTCKFTIKDAALERTDLNVFDLFLMP